MECFKELLNYAMTYLYYDDNVPAIFTLLLDAVSTKENIRGHPISTYARFSKKPNISNPLIRARTSEAVRSSRPEVFLVKGVLKICTKFTGEQSSRSVISIKLQSKFIDIWNQTSAWLFLCKFAAYFTKNTSGRLLLNGRGVFRLLPYDNHML